MEQTCLKAAEWVAAQLRANGMENVQIFATPETPDRLRGMAGSHGGTNRPALWAL